MEEVEFHQEFSCLPNRYEYICKIGCGSFGKVVKFKDKNMPEGKQGIAIKLFRKTNLDIIHAKYILREIFILRTLKHKNIVNLRHVLLFKINETVNIFLIFDFWMGDLNAVIEDRKKDNKLKITDLHIKYIMYQLLKGISFLHENKCMHRDIKPNNILINSNTCVALTDFGYARIFDQLNPLQTIYVFVKIYRAPEIIFLEKYDIKGDIWALGWIFFQLIKGKHPLEEGIKNKVQLLNKILELFGTPSKSYQKLIDSEHKLDWLRKKNFIEKKKISELLDIEDKDALDLIDKMICFDYRERISAKEALDHAYFNSYKNTITDKDKEKILKERNAENIINEDYLYKESKLNLEDYKRMIIKEINLVNLIAGEVQYDSWENIPVYEAPQVPDLPINSADEETGESIVYEEN